MKKLSALLLVLLLAVPYAGFAEENDGPARYTSGDYEYIILDDGTAEIAKHKGSATEVTIPSTLDGKRVSRIGNTSFGGNFSLVSVVIPYGVTKIDIAAFADCVCLTSVTIPDSVTDIGTLAFSDCLELPCVSLPNSVTRIGQRAFEGCESMTSFTIPDSVTQMGDNPFGICKNLTEMILSPDHPYLYMEDGVLFSRPDHRLISCVNPPDLTLYEIPDGTEIIGGYAFEWLDLYDVAIPGSVREIGDAAFYNCDQMHFINIPEGVEKIGDYIVLGDYIPFTASLPGSLTSISDEAFSLCYDMTCVVPRDSYAEQYCIEHTIRYEYNDPVV